VIKLKILVTGGAGFIGSNISMELDSKNYDVTVLDDFSSGNFKNLLGFNGDMITSSIKDLTLKNIDDFDVIFHQAAITDTTVHDQKIMMETNTEEFKKLLKFSVEHDIKFVYASSAATYGNSPSPQKEENAGYPNNIYGFSKWACDCVAKQYMLKNPDSHIVGLRYFNVFGPREQYKGKMASMIWQLLKQMQNGEKPRIFEFGEQKRDQVYVKNIVDINLLAMNAKSSCIVNACSGCAVSFNEIIDALNECLGYNYEPEYIKNPYSEFYQDHTEGSLDLATKFLGYTPKWNFKEGVIDYINWLKENNYI
jgi:ADP-L-glycero-D-manno-heptose 6-epimerase